MGLRPCWFVWRLALGIVLLARSSEAVDRPSPRDNHSSVRRDVYSPPTKPTPSLDLGQHRSANSPQMTAADSFPSAPGQLGVWDRIENQIRKPVERRAKPLVDSAAELHFAAAKLDESATIDRNASIEAEGAAVVIDPLNAASYAEDNDAASAVDAPRTTDMVELRAKIHDVLSHYQTRKLNTRDHNPWEVMHEIVAFNVSTEVLRGGPNGTPVDAVNWLLCGGRCQGQLMLTLRRGRPHAEEGVGVQGHPAQLLAILAQSRVTPNTPMRIGGKNFTLEDLIEQEMRDCRADIELTFKLISLSHYLTSDAVWRSRDGQLWSIPRLIHAEIKAPIRGAACGGTHRLFGINYAYQMREKDGRPLDGEFLRAKQYTASYHRYAWSLQNPDGSFSTEWFARRSNRPDIERKIQTTGHIMEWLVASLSDEQLRDPRLIKSVDFLATSLLNEPNRPWSIGPMGHALHALVMYEERICAPRAERPTALADVAPSAAPDRADEAQQTEPTSDNETEASAETAAEIGPLLRLR